MMKKLFCSLLFLLAVQLSAAAEKSAVWGCYVPQKTDSSFSVTGANLKSCKLHLKRGQEKQSRIWCAAIAGINKTMWSQNKLAFSCRNTGKKPLNFSCGIAWKSGSRSGHSGTKAFTLPPGEQQDMILDLDDDFRLHDAEHTILQLKFFAEITAWAAGDQGTLELDNIRFCTPAELSLSGNVSGKVIVIPPGKPYTEVNKKGMLNVFFHLDNEDLTPIAFDWKMRKLDEKQPTGGFRELLLEQVRDQVRITTDLNDADVIVYSRGRPDPEMAQKVAEKVRQGTPLLLTAQIADPEIAGLLSGRVIPVQYNGLPQRKKLKFPQNNHPSARNAVLNDAAFGIYHKLENINGTPLLLYEDNTPAALEIRENNMHIILSLPGIGSDVLVPAQARDPWFLRMLGALTARQFPEQPLQPVKPDQDGFYEGASKNNFGRFGWELGDGLLCSGMSNKLQVSNAVAEYSFSPDLRHRILLDEWLFTAKNSEKKQIPWNWKWNIVGTAVLDCKITIPADWRGTAMAFSAEKGIDDTAKVLFNGVEIGEVTEKDEEYWMRPHFYQIPEKLIRFGAENHVRVITRNLRGSGGFGSCPEITTVSPGNEVKVYVDRINYLGKGAKITINGREFGRFDTSLAFPGVRWQFQQKKVLMQLHNIARYAVFQKQGKFCTVDLLKQPELPGKFDSPYLLLFNGKTAGYPLLLVFDKPMQKLRAVNVSNQVRALEISADSAIGMITPIWISGAGAVNTENWAKVLPGNIRERISLWGKRAFRFPDACREYFRVDWQKKQVEIRNKYTYITTPNFWNITSPAYAPVPPMAMSMKDILCQADRTSVRDLPTVFGYFADRDNSDTVYWRLPLPENDLSVRPHSRGLEKLEKLANNHFRSAVRFSAGGGLRQEEWNCAYPGSKKLPWMVNLNMHGFLMGLPVCTENPFIYTAENRQKLLQRITARLCLPLEQFQYKLALRYREEPYSKIRYTIYMNSPREMTTAFTPGSGSKVVYGDSNETVCMFLTTLQHLADRFGQSDLIRANYSTIVREIITYLMTQDDYGILASGCVEFGGSWSIDMLNCEYASMMKLARLAEIAGDKALQEQALYRAARRMIPTLSRLYLQEYAGKHGLLPENGLAALGFGEAELKFYIRNTPVRGLDLYDMSQGIPGDLTALYSKYARERINDLYLSQVAETVPAKLDYTLAAALALHGTQSDEKLLNILDAVSRNSYLSGRLCGDWGGMCTGSYLAYSIHRLKGKVLIQRTKNIDIKSAVFDPVKNRLEIVCTANEQSELVLATSLRCLSKEFHQKADGTIELPMKPGKQYFSINFHN